MAGVHALVAEDAADLVDLLKAADDQALEIELRLDAQVHRDVQCVVVRDEGTGVRADLDGLQHGRVDLEEALAVQKLAQRLDDLAALDEHVLDLGVDDGIDVALTVAHVLILEAVPLLRQHAQRLREQLQMVRVHGNLARLRAEHRAADADDVADVHGLEVGIDVLADVLAADIGLNLPLAVEHVHEGRLAHDPAAHHAAGDGDLLPLKRLKALENLAGGVRAVIVGDGVGIAALGLILEQLGAADLLLFAQLRRGKHFFCHGNFPLL